MYGYGRKYVWAQLNEITLKLIGKILIIHLKTNYEYPYIDFNKDINITSTFFSLLIYAATLAQHNTVDLQSGIVLLI